MRHSATHRRYPGSGVLGRREHGAVGGLLKRLFDMIVATLVLALLAPILIFTGILIRLLLGTPILVSERSVGLGGHVFALLSFRTDPNSSTWADPMTEAITTALRACGVDKLPHLFNVVRGDMSLVGPELIDARHAQDYGKDRDCCWHAPVWSVCGAMVCTFCVHP